MAMKRVNQMEYPKNILYAIHVPPNAYETYEELTDMDTIMRSCLYEKEYQIMNLYFKEHLTLREVGNRIEMKREETVHQNKEKALRKIKVRLMKEIKTIIDKREEYKKDSETTLNTIITKLNRIEYCLKILLERTENDKNS